MPRGGPDEVLKCIRPGERFTVTDIYAKLPHRTNAAVKAYVRKLVDAGALVICGTSPTPMHPNRAMYRLADNAPDIRTKQTQLVEAVGPEEVVSSTVMRQRFPDWNIAAIATALRNAAAAGRLAKCGEMVHKDKGQKVLLYCRPDAAAASRTAYDVSVDDAPPPLAPGEVLPFVALMTPPVPKFRILRTQVVGVR